MKKARIITGIIIFIVVIAITIVVLRKMGFIVVGDVDKEYYKVRGVAVSELHGEIDWPTLANVEKISYVFVKATGGTIDKDKKFALNFNSALKNGIVPGAYHEFNIESGGEAQASHFTSTYTSKATEVLPPIVKVFIDEELSEDKSKAVITELDILMKAIYNKYDKAPILYTDNLSYQNYLRHVKELDIYPICIENTVYQPMIMDDKDWTFWQYATEGKVQGISADVVKSVYYSSQKDFSYFYRGDFLSQQREFKQKEKEANKN